MRVSVFFHAFCIVVFLAAPVVVVASGTLTTLLSFNKSNGEVPYGDLAFDAAGNIYGTTSGAPVGISGGGGPTADGTVFEITAGTHAFSTLLTFNGTNGQFPFGGIISDSVGNLYGTVVGGGTAGYGEVFKIATGTGNVSTFASFNGTTNGSGPRGDLAFDASGNLYGAGYGSGLGTVFKVAAGANTATTVGTFAGGSGGSYPDGGVIVDAAGNLYGTTQDGGPTNDGTVFKIAAGTNTVNTLAYFTSAVNGRAPLDDLVMDAAGNLFGTTLQGGSTYDGTIFEIFAGTGALEPVITFAGIANGERPCDRLIMDASGNLFGTTEEGGANNGGTVFEFNPNTGVLTTLYSFGGNDGALPFSGLIADASGNLYGTTSNGGTGKYGTVFELSGTGFAVPEPSFIAVICGSIIVLLSRRRSAIPGFAGL